MCEQNSKLHFSSSREVQKVDHCQSEGTDIKGAGSDVTTELCLGTANLGVSSTTISSTTEVCRDGGTEE
jgi:hypothetical protein